MRHFIVIIVLVLVGCQDIDRPQPPENLLPKQKVVEVLADAYTGNAIRSKSVNNRILRNKGVQLDSILYAKHQVDSLSFAQSNAYYATDLDVYTEMMTQVEKILVKKKNELEKMISTDPKYKAKAADSLVPNSVTNPSGDELIEAVEEEIDQ